MKTHNKCDDCGKCCLRSNMILSEQEYKKILKKFKDLKQFDIWSIDEDGFLRMLTIEHECIFLDKTTKKCSIYKVRPKGCRFYPLIYDFELQKCRFGEICPKPQEFYPDEKKLKKICKKNKSYLKKKLFIINVT